MKISTKLTFLNKKHIEGTKKTGESFAFDNYMFLDNELNPIQLGLPYGCDDNVLKAKINSLEPMKEYQIELNLSTVNNYIRLSIVGIK